MNLEILAEQIEACRACPLHKKATPLCGLGQGKVMLVGASATSEDELMREPFSERKGQLIRKALAEANLDTYLTNLVKCPGSHKLAIRCKGWLWQEIKLVSPQAIIPLGAKVTSLLLKNVSFSKAVGESFKVDYFDGIVAPWYDSSYLLMRGVALYKDTVIFFRKVRDGLV